MSSRNEAENRAKRYNEIFEHSDGLLAHGSLARTKITVKRDKFME